MSIHFRNFVPSKLNKNGSPPIDKGATLIMINNIKKLTNKQFIEQDSAMLRTMSAFGYFSLMGYTSQLHDMHYSFGGGFYECSLWAKSENEAAEIAKEISRQFMRDGDSIQIGYLENSEIWTIDFRATFGK